MSCTVCILLNLEIMSCIITVALVSVWITVTSCITFPSTSTSVPNTFSNVNPYIVNTLQYIWQSGTSCEVIFNANPSNPTGDYRIDAGGKITTIHCNMDQKLCGKDGPWTRIGYLDMSESLHNCPLNWEEYAQDTGGIRTCQRRSSGASCDSVIIPSTDIQYTEICGRVVGYQYASPDAVYSNGQDINSYNYVDGVSITRGTPRQHVWTLMAGLNQNGEYGYYSQCPCYTGCGGRSCSQWRKAQSFIGNDWYCESGNNDYYTWNYKSYMSDPLWDGQGCSTDEFACCAQKSGQPPQPWFYKFIPGGTKDNLEIRICADEDKYYADVLVTMYELYVK